MKLGIVDSTVVVHLYRRRISSLEWLQLQPGRHLVTPITWLETLVGAGSKRAMMDAEAILRRFQVVHFTSSDQTWSIEQMGLLRLS
jgi:predicted nucleic acid-binding protein